MTDTPVPTHVLLAAFDKSAAARAALREDEVVAVNLDVVPACLTVIGSLPEIRAIRPQIADTLPKFNLEQIDQCEEYAYGLFHANRLLHTADAPVASLVTLSDKASAIRERLMSVASMLAKLGLISGARLNDIKGLNGYRNIGVDVANLAQILRTSWSAIDKKTPLTLAEIDEAEAIATELLQAVAIREQGPPATASVVQERQRAFTLLSRTYEEVRWAVIYTRRREGDADQIAPSLYAGRNGGARPKKAEPSAPTPAPTAPVATPAVPATPHAAALDSDTNPFVTS